MGVAVRECADSVGTFPKSVSQLCLLSERILLMGEIIKQRSAAAKLTGAAVGVLVERLRT
jgi:hypothetical protein